MYFLGKKQGYNGEQLKKILDRSLKPTGQILLVITGGGIIRWVLQDCGMGNIIGPALEKSGLPLVLVTHSCSSDPRICWCGSCGYDNGSRNYGCYARSCRPVTGLSGGNGLCHQRRCNGIQPYK